MFWEDCAMITAWNSNMNQQFSPGYANCLDESMSVWTNQFTCPGFMFIPCKPWPFGNEYFAKEHFAEKEIGTTDSWAGKMDDVPFHVFSMKESD